jgi:hypothetical protein
MQALAVLQRRRHSRIGWWKIIIGTRIHTSSYEAYPTVNIVWSRAVILCTSRNTGSFFFVWSLHLILYRVSKTENTLHCWASASVRSCVVSLGASLAGARRAEGPGSAGRGSEFPGRTRHVREPTTWNPRRIWVFEYSSLVASRRCLTERWARGRVVIIDPAKVAAGAGATETGVPPAPGPPRPREQRQGFGSVGFDWILTISFPFLRKIYCCPRKLNNRYRTWFYYWRHISSACIFTLLYFIDICFSSVLICCWVTVISIVLLGF